MPIRSWMSLIMGQIKPEHPELFALEFGKIDETDFVYTLASTNINQSAPNLGKMFVTVRSWKSSIMNLIWREWSELSALYLKNCFIWLCLHSIICKYRPVSTKLEQNIYVQQNLNESGHGSIWIRTTGVISSWIGKNCCIQLCLLSSIHNINQSATILVTIYMSIRFQMSLIMGQVIPDQSVSSALEIEKLNFSSLFDIYPYC